MRPVAQGPRAVRRLKPLDSKTGEAVNVAQRPLWLVKGVDRCGLNDFSMGHAPHA